MKKILLLALSLLLVAGITAGLCACTPPAEKSYSLDTSGFDSTAVFGETISLSGLKLVADGETVAVTPDMVTGLDTSTAGKKEMTVSYNGQTFKAEYTVKFRVTYVIEGATTVQLVSSVAEVVVPETPDVLGKQFDRWSVSLPKELTANLRIEAMYKTLSSETEDVYTWSGEGLIDLGGYAEDLTTLEYTVTDLSGNALSEVLVKEGGKLRYSLGTNTAILVSIGGEGVIQKSWKVSKTDEPALSIANGNEAVGITLGSNRYSEKITVSKTPIGFKYEVTLSNSNINVAESNGYVFIDVVKAGVTELTVKAVNSTNELEYVTLTQFVVVTPATITVPNTFIDNNAIESVWTVGRVNSDRLPTLAIGGVNAEKVGEGFYENLTWSVSSDNVTVSKDGRITLGEVTHDPEIVEIRAVFGYKGVSVSSAPIKVRCVYDGINVFSYSELYTETLRAEPRRIVLQTDIKDDFSSENYTWMTSTYDLTYYYNIGKTENDMRIKVLLQIKNDLYGNGYEINAHNATLGMLDATGSPTDKTLFKGPLNFVAMADTGGAISVKAQDNIVFAIYENVTVNNVVLKSCDLEAVDGAVDLTDLEFAGTTVEVLGDGVTIEYSRLMNGRTVLRVFGDAHDAEREINVTVKNTIIKCSREFNARIGSNRFVEVEGVASPCLPGDDGDDYKSKQSYNSMSDAEKAAYDESYINTFVTFENVVFEDAGIFAIGVDAHFAGEALRDGSSYLSGALVGWKNLAKTSYGAKVTLKDDVRLYSWKDVQDIDSGTIIENTFASDGTGDGNVFANLQFDIKNIILNAAKMEGYSNLLFRFDGKDYVHTGIVLFGGGKNYSVVENLITSDFNHTFSEYNVTLRELEGQGYLETASGGEAFYFIAYNKNSTFTYVTQITMTDKYNCLYK